MFKIRYFAQYAAMIAAVVSAMAAGQARAADDKIPAADKERTLIGVLQSDAPPQDKAITCKQLAIYGSKEAVPALAALLPDKDLASWARIALEAIPDPAADDALRQAMGKLQGRLLIGVINSIGFRRDAKSVDGLVQRLKDADAEVASAAAVALGRVGNASAAQALERSLAGAPAAVRSSVAQGCILSAERMMADGKREEAVKLYDLVRKSDVPKPRVIEATRGAILARQSAGVPLLVEQLKSADKSLFALGLWTARELPGREVTDALVAELKQASPERQGLLILALADRGDAAALPQALQAAKSGPDQVRIAAFRVLGRLGDASCLPVLLEAAMEANADVSQAAVTVLADLPGKAVDDDLAARLLKSQGKARQVLTQLAGLRRIAAAVPALLKDADNPDAEIRAVALAALGATIEARDLPLLIGRVANPQKPEDAKAAEDALSAACIRMPDREACAGKLVAAMSQAAAPAKCKFLEILGAMGGEKALQAVSAAAKDTSPEIQDAGSRLLGEWMTADAAPVLLELAKTAAEPKYRIRALRGYIRIARQLDLPVAKRMAMCREALKFSQRDEEKKLVVEVLRRHPCAESLSLVVSQVGKAGSKLDTGAAAVAIAEKIIQSEPAAVAEAMKQVVEASGDGNVAVRAKALLEQASQKRSDKK